MTNQVQDNKKAVVSMTIQGWVLIGLIISFVGAVFYGSMNINKIQKDITALNTYTDSTLRDSTAFLQPADVKLMVDSSSREAFDTYVSTQGNLLAIVAVLITVIVIVIPLILNNNFRNTNEEWFRKKVEDVENNMNNELQKGMDKLKVQSSEGVKAIEEKVNKQKADIEGHQTKIDEQAKTVARQAEEIKTLKENIEKITNDYRLEVEHGESLKQVEKKDSRKEKIEYLEKEIKKNKENYPASGYYELGRLYFEEGEYNKSIGNFKIAVDRKPDYVEAYQALAEAYIKVNNLEEAWKKIELALGLGIKETSGLLETRCKVFTEMGLYEDAKKDAISGLDLALKEGDLNRRSNLEKHRKNIETEIQKRIEEEVDKVITVDEINFRMKMVKGGAFTMGATNGDPEASEDEKPAHRVLLYDYYIGETAVTQALWKTVMGTSLASQQRNKADITRPLMGEGDNYPMFYLSWKECQEFIRKLNSNTGEKFRLPTEAEWEYAARGGEKSNGYKFAGEDTLDDVAWHYKNCDGIRPVKCKMPNELGVYDMSGNIWEWCQDWFGSYCGSEQTNPQGPSNGSYRVLRGGCWDSYAWDCRVSSRIPCDPAFGDCFVGFRLVLPL